MESQKLQRKIDIIITTVFGVGFLKPSPGTYGSLLATIFILAPSNYQLYFIFFLIAISFFSINSIKRMELEFGDDPSIIIIDEFVAMGLIYLSGFLSNDLIVNILAFIFFRIFDILKPFPINLLNKKKGAIYVMADDFLAAIFTLIILKLLIFINNLFNIISFII